MTVTDPVTEVRSTFQQSPVTARPRIGVVLHHAATTDIDQVISMETTGSREVSSNRVVKDSRCVKIANDPDFRAWSLSDAYWDSVLSSVECADQSTDGWTISATSHETLAQQVAWWAQRDGFRPHRDGDRSGWTVFGHREIYLEFGDSYATACPGGMNLDLVTVRAREILAGDSTPITTRLDDDDMRQILDTKTGTVAVVGIGRYYPLGESTGTTMNSANAIAKVTGPYVACTHEEVIEIVRAYCGDGIDLSKPFSTHAA